MNILRSFPALLALSFPTGIEILRPEKIEENSGYSPSYSFDALGRLRSIRHEDASRRWTARDLGGRAVAQTTTNSLGKVQGAAIFHNDGARRIAANALPGASAGKRFVYGRALDELLVQESGGAQLAPVVSSLGSTMKLVNSAGSIADQFRYDAFGAPLAGDTKAFSHFFAGANYDPKAKLYDMRHRHYDPRIGRFLSRDSLGMHADSFNTGNAYSYVGNNPLTRRDPMGLMGNEWWENALQITCGVGEMVGGAVVAAASTVATPFTGGVSTAGIIGGGALMGHGADQFIAGVRSAWSGEDVPTLVETGVQAIGEAAGLTPEQAAAVATGVDAGLGTALSLGASGPLNGARGAVAIAGLADDGARAIAKPAAVVAAELTGQAAAKGAAVGEAARAAAALTEPALMTGKGEGPREAKDCPEPGEPEWLTESKRQRKWILKDLERIDRSVRGAIRRLRKGGNPSELRKRYSNITHNSGIGNAKLVNSDKKFNLENLAQLRLDIQGIIFEIGTTPLPTSATLAKKYDDYILILRTNGIWGL